MIILCSFWDDNIVTKDCIVSQAKGLISGDTPNHSVLVNLGVKPSSSGFASVWAQMPLT